MDQAAKIHQFAAPFCIVNASIHGTSSWWLKLAPHVCRPLHPVDPMAYYPQCSVGILLNLVIFGPPSHQSTALSNATPHLCWQKGRRNLIYVSFGYGLLPATLVGSTWLQFNRATFDVWSWYHCRLLFVGCHPLAVGYTIMGLLVVGSTIVDFVGCTIPLSDLRTNTNFDGTLILYHWWWQIWKGIIDGLLMACWWYYTTFLRHQQAILFIPLMTAFIENTGYWRYNSREMPCRWCLGSGPWLLGDHPSYTIHINHNQPWSSSMGGFSSILVDNWYLNLVDGCGCQPLFVNPFACDFGHSDQSWFIKPLDLWIIFMSDDLIINPFCLSTMIYQAITVMIVCWWWLLPFKTRGKNRPLAAGPHACRHLSSDLVAREVCGCRLSVVVVVLVVIVVVVLCTYSSVSRRWFCSFVRGLWSAMDMLCLVFLGLYTWQLQNTSAASLKFARWASNYIPGFNRNIWRYWSYLSLKMWLWVNRFGNCLKVFFLSTTSLQYYITTQTRPSSCLCTNPPQLSSTVNIQ